MSDVEIEAGRLAIANLVGCNPADCVDCDCRTEARAAILASRAALLAEGWKVIFQYPTTAMRTAGSRALLPPSMDFADEVWRAMWDKAP